MDELPKYLTAEQEAELVKERKEKRAKVLESLLEALPKQRFASDYLAREGAKTVTINCLGRELARVSKKLTRRFFESLFEVSDNLEEFMIFQRNRCRKLEAEIASLKAAPPPTLSDSYRGVWAPATVYVRGSVITRDGGLWLAMSDTGAKPGDDASGWVLIVKRGRDAADRHKHRPGDPA